MAARQAAPYGAWASPITADLIVAGTVTLGQIQLDGRDTYWVEGRPAEGGRNVVVRRGRDGLISDLSPPPFDVRTRVHEYGGGAYLVEDAVLYFSNFEDNRLYRQPLGGEATPLTAPGPWRYGDMVADMGRNRLIAVREDHSVPDQEATNTVVAINLDSGKQQVLVTGNDFYAAPRLDTAGRRLAWLSWNHPNMPWDGSELWVGEIATGGSIGSADLVVGGPSESIFQPEWSPEGALHFVSDRSGWWNIYRAEAGELEPLLPMEAEFGRPQWAFRMATYGFRSAHQIVAIYIKQGTYRLAVIDTTQHRMTPIETAYSDLSDLRVQAERAVLIAASPSVSAEIVQLDLPDAQPTVLRRSSAIEVLPAYISSPRPIEFPTENDSTAFAFYYPPRNTDFEAPEGELPPLIVHTHGGPTGHVTSALRLPIQFWTSRGFAVVAVNYGGSSGYGRAYRQRLKGRWGVVDVDDSVNAARYLVAEGLVDPNRLLIQGGSAGGYTTLCALTFRDIFRAGASYFGISDLIPFVADTHKFESRYVAGLVGPYPQAEELYRERSPINHIDRLNAPVILFQGLEDKIVPPNQAELMVEALRAKGIPYAYIAFEGEGHGFRKAENIKRMLEGELYFYSRLFGFDLSELVDPVAVENLGTPV